MTPSVFTMRPMMPPCGTLMNNIKTLKDDVQCTQFTKAFQIRCPFSHEKCMHFIFYTTDLSQSALGEISREKVLQYKFNRASIH